MGRYPLLVIDALGYIPFAPKSAKRLFQVVLSRYERAPLPDIDNRPSGRWGEAFGDDAVAAAIIDRVVPHEVVAIKGDSSGQGRLVRFDNTGSPAPHRYDRRPTNQREGSASSRPPGCTSIRR